MNSSQLIQWLKTKNAYEIMSHNKITFLTCRTNPFHVKMYGLWTYVHMLYHHCGTQDFSAKNTETEVSSSDDTYIIYKF